MPTGKAIAIPCRSFRLISLGGIRLKVAIKLAETEDSGELRFFTVAI